MIIGSISCKAILPIIFTTLVVNLALTSLLIGLTALIIYKLMRKD